jgi:hypothetical protein
MDLAIRITHLASEVMLQTMLLFWTGTVFLIAGTFALLRSDGVKQGMSEDEVRDTMGRPTRTARSSARAKWIYNSRSRERKTVVSFRAGRVSRVRSSAK